jgi:hypothetical protein
MNNCDLAYSSYNCNGTRRPGDYSAARFIAAWRRTVLILRGGDAGTVNARLAALHLPPVQGAAGALPVPQVALVWSPMTGGSPMICALRPQVFWPGAKYVDWVGLSGYYFLPDDTFKYIFEPVISQVRKFTNDPILIAETGVSSGPKAAFNIKDLFHGLRAQHLIGMVWFDLDKPGPLYHGGKWRLEGHATAVRTFRAALAGT